MPLGVVSITRGVLNRARRGLYAGRLVRSGNNVSEDGHNKYVGSHTVRRDELMHSRMKWGITGVSLMQRYAPMWLGMNLPRVRAPPSSLARGDHGARHAA